MAVLGSNPASVPVRFVRGRAFRRYSVWSRVWGRHPDELAVVVTDPVGEGVVRMSGSQRHPVTPSHEELRRGAKVVRDSSSIERGHEPLSSQGSQDPSGMPLLRAEDIIQVVLRPAVGRDHVVIDNLRLSDRPWLAPWEPTSPPQATAEPPTLREYMRTMDRMMRRGEALMMVVEVNGHPVGVVNASNVHRGALHDCSVGYWVVSWASGLGLGSWAVATVIDMLITELGLHRVEVNIRTENVPSLALARRLGLREEGLKQRYVHINGRWTDHIQFSIDTESLPEFGLVESLLSQSDA